MKIACSCEKVEQEHLVINIYSPGPSFKKEGQIALYMLASLKLGNQYAISQLRFVRWGLDLVYYLDVGNFSDKSTEITLHEICVEVFLRLFDSR